MKLYTVTYQDQTFPALETRPGVLVRLPYETMNALLTDAQFSKTSEFL